MSDVHPQNGDRMEGRALAMVSQYDRAIREEMEQMRAEMRRSTRRRIAWDLGSVVAAIAIVVTVWLSVLAKVDAATGKAANATQETAVLRTDLDAHVRAKGHEPSREKQEDLAQQVGVLNATIESFSADVEELKTELRRARWRSRRGE